MISIKNIEKFFRSLNYYVLGSVANSEHTFQNSGRGYYFPITEVEEHLAHYKVIPYKSKKSPLE
jgi:hypothetical protein